MVNKPWLGSPLSGFVSLPNGRTLWLINGGPDPNYWIKSWDDPPRREPFWDGKRFARCSTWRLAPDVSDRVVDGGENEITLKINVGLLNPSVLPIYL